MKPNRLLFVILLLGTVVSAGCQRNLSPDELIGTYELVIGTNQSVSRKDISSSRLNLQKDGTFSQICVFKGGVSESIKGNWHIFENKIQFSSFRDCAGVWPPEWNKKDGAASLVVERTSPPVILISPDHNVFYSRR